MFCYIDLDLDDSRASYARACDFVEKSSIKYGLSSNVLAQLGGREKISVPELVSSDYQWATKGRVQCHPQQVCRLVVELFPESSPLAVENFTALCTGSKGKSRSSGVPLTYEGSIIHRYVPGFVMQGGDFVFSNGSGGESIWGKKFKDDQKGLKLKHNKRGVLSMGNSGKNSNSSQFFLTLGNETKACDGKHTIFGQMIHGFEVLDLIEEEVRNSSAPCVDEAPPFSIRITSCGMWDPTKDLVQGHWAPDNSFQAMR